MEPFDLAITILELRSECSRRYKEYRRKLRELYTWMGVVAFGLVLVALAGFTETETINKVFAGVTSLAAVYRLGSTNVELKETVLNYTKAVEELNLFLGGPE